MGLLLPFPRHLAALFVNGAPFGVIGVLRLVVCGIHVVNTAGEAGIHNGEILIRQSDVHDEIRLVALDKVTKLLHVVCIDLCRGDFCLVMGASFAASASHLDFVRLAMHSSVKTSLTWQHLEMATPATPPQPITRTLLMMELLCILLYCMMCMDVL